MKRLKILCVILLIVFFGSIYQDAVLPFLDGVKYGLTIAKYQMHHNKKTEDFTLMDVVPKDNNYLDDSETNLRTGEKVLIRPSNLTVMIHSLPQKPRWLFIFQGIYFVFTVIILILGIWVPFLVVKIVRSLHQSQVFEHQNLKRIQRIGIILLVVGILSSVLQFINIESAKSVIDLLHYQFSYSKVIDFNLLILGIIVLIMNEILRIGTEMKEEQDLTI